MNTPFSANGMNQNMASFLAALAANPSAVNYILAQVQHQQQQNNLSSLASALQAQHAASGLPVFQNPTCAIFPQQNTHGPNPLAQLYSSLTPNLNAPPPQALHTQPMQAQTSMAKIERCTDNDVMIATQLRKARQERRPYLEMIEIIVATQGSTSHQWTAYIVERLDYIFELMGSSSNPLTPPRTAKRPIISRSSPTSSPMQTASRPRSSSTAKHADSSRARKRRRRQEEEDEEEEDYSDSSSSSDSGTEPDRDKRRGRAQSRYPTARFILLSPEVDGRKHGYLDTDEVGQPNQPVTAGDLNKLAEWILKHRTFEGDGAWKLFATENNSRALNGWKEIYRRRKEEVHRRVEVMRKNNANDAGDTTLHRDDSGEQDRREE